MPGTKQVSAEIFTLPKFVVLLFFELQFPHPQNKRIRINDLDGKGL